VTGGRALALVLIALVTGGCSMPSWNPAWVPAWVPVLGSDQGDTSPPPKRTASRQTQPMERPLVRPDDDEMMTERVVAVVNNDAITLGELEEAMAAARAAGAAGANDTEVMRREFLNRFIESRLQLQEADREKVTVDEAEIDEELLERIKKSNVKDLEEFKEGIKSQGLSYEAVRRRLRENIKMAKIVRRKVALRISVTEGEIDTYLAENREKLDTGLSYHARHILIVPEGVANDATWEGARIRTELVRTQLREGADFAELAKRYSGDATAKDGGDLGTLKRGELAQDIESRILALKPGEVSEPFRSDLGYHIFRLETKETLEGEGLTRTRNQIREILFRQKYEARFDAWLREIRERAVIEVRM
jgi:peptidyl-prolyl cis-trans isomerase SurA